MRGNHLLPANCSDIDAYFFCEEQAFAHMLQPLQSDEPTLAAKALSL